MMDQGEYRTSKRYAVSQLVGWHAFVQRGVVWFSASVACFAFVVQTPDGRGHCCAAENASAGTEFEIDEIEIDDFDRDHWAYQPIQSVTPPDVSNDRWPRNAIDCLILAALESRQLRPGPPADRVTLLRRLTFDLTGLPPTPAELDGFVNDVRPGAYERLVERLLASPAYGRRWGQYWLDLARFAETDGYEHDKIRPTAWQYRDWVINALNRDLPYDEFVRQQIAGDALYPDDPDAAIATAFCLSGPDMPDINSQSERRHVLMNEITSTVGAAILGLQVGCAQCHDHKYDAISQADFYRLRAFFEPAVQFKRNESVTTLHPVADADAIARFYIRGDWRRAGPTVVAAFPRIANPQGTRVRATDPGQQRIELARWLTDPANPLTARTIVNRIWQHHFGRGLSSTPSDFGVMGQEPTHPELLDYLARYLIEQGWSLKQLHRFIVNSAVYRTASVPPTDPVSLADWRATAIADPDNRLLARFPRRRLDAESIRDAMLATSGSLNCEVDGPGVSPPLPVEMIKTLKSGQWKNSSRVADHYRPSIYIFARRNLRYPLFATFDRPAANCSCAVRHPSTTPIQSLLLLNSKITLDAAQRLVSHVRSRRPNLAEQVSEIYRCALSRDPDTDELAEALQFVEDQIRMVRESHGADPASAALTDLCRALFNSNQFLYVD